MAEPFSFELEETGRALVLRIHGELDLLTARSAGAAAAEALRRPGPGLVVSLEDTDFIDSTGLAVLLNARRRCARAGRGFAVVCPPSTQAVRPLQIARLMDTLNVCDEEDQAMLVVERESAATAP